VSPDTLNLFTQPASLLFGSDKIFHIRYLTHAGIISSVSSTSFSYKTEPSAAVISNIGLISAGVSVVKYLYALANSRRVISAAHIANGYP
jgi:hypothetical protein